MPILIKDYTWHQTKKFIILWVPLKGVRHFKADICISPRYVKVSFEQHYFEMILPHRIDESKSKATINKSEIVFELRKTSDQYWNTLELPSESLENESRLKKTLMEATWSKIKNKDEERRNIKSELKKVAVRKQIETDTTTRENIASNKKKEERQVTGEVLKWKEDLNRKHKTHQRTRNPSPNRKATAERKILKGERPKAATNTVEVEFTPRKFPTPKRESTKADEMVFLKQQAETRRISSFSVESFRLDERNPQFIKIKADEFMAEENYYAAVSAYSYCIKMEPWTVEFYIGRCRALFSMGYLIKTLEDCSEILKLLRPYCDYNCEERAECIGRRALVMFRLGLRQYAQQQIRFSLRLYPNPGLQEFYDTANFEESY